MPSDETCPRCGSNRPSSGPSGLCPECLLRLGFGADLSAGPADTLSLAGLRDPEDEPRGQATGVLHALHESIGPVPRILLRDGPGEAGPRPVRPRSDEMPDLAGEGGRYQLLGEIARRGMGVVLKGRDVDLGRDLAVKVLLEKHRDHPEMVRRFVEEAQIGGQLQHPGIVPVYELGQFPDHRLNIAMKLVGGRTLAALLGSRKDPADDRSRFLSTFEQVCQTIAYAHPRGVIHRDHHNNTRSIAGRGAMMADRHRPSGLLEESAPPPRVESPMRRLSPTTTGRSSSPASPPCKSRPPGSTGLIKSSASR